MAPDRPPSVLPVVRDRVSRGAWSGLPRTLNAPTCHTVVAPATAPLAARTRRCACGSTAPSFGCRRVANGAHVLLEAERRPHETWGVCHAEVRHAHEADGDGARRAQGGAGVNPAGGSRWQRSPARKSRASTSRGVATTTSQSPLPRVASRRSSCVPHRLPPQPPTASRGWRPHLSQGSIAQRPRRPRRRRRRPPRPILKSFLRTPASRARTRRRR